MILNIRKAFDKLLKMIFFVISPFIILIIVLLYPIIKIRIGSIPSQRIGHLSQEMELYLCEKKKSFDIFFSQNEISNLTLHSLIKKKLITLNPFVLWPIYLVLQKLTKFFYFFKNHIVDTSVYDKSNNFNNKVKIDIDKNFKTKGEKFLRSIGISKKDKLVLLCIRDGYYLKRKFKNINYSYHNYRDCDQKNYKLAIMYLIKKGYYVLKMGESSKNDLNIKSKKFINYSKYFKNDFLDIYLSYRCTFNISTSTGIDGVSSYIFKKPLLVTNIAPLRDVAQYSTWKNFMLTFKEYGDLNTKKKLNFREIKKRGLFDNHKAKEFKKKGVFVIENDPITIKKATVEMLNFINFRNYNKKNNFFWKNYENFFSIKNGHYYSRAISTVSREFLKKRNYLFK